MALPTPQNNNWCASAVASPIEVEYHCNNSDWRLAMRRHVTHRCRECVNCDLGETCEYGRVPLVTWAMLSDGAFLRAARESAQKTDLGTANGAAAIVDLYSNLPVSVSVQVRGRELATDLAIEELFLPNDDLIAKGTFAEFARNLRFWCRDFLGTPIPDTVLPRVYAPRARHAQAVFTLLAAHRPEEARRW